MNLHSRHLVPRRLWDQQPWNRWTFQHVRELLPTANVWRGPGPASALHSQLLDIEMLEFKYKSQIYTIESLLEDSFTDGFIVVHGGKIILERYMNGLTESALHLSQSVSKSIVGLVAGILADRGILDVDAQVTSYLPELEQTAYRGARIQHLLDMTSGVAFNEEDSGPDSDIAKLDSASGWKPSHRADWPANIRALILSLTRQEWEHGERFHYRSVETDVLALALERAAGDCLPNLASRMIWSPLGAQEDAYYTVDSAGFALADSGFNATLRDHARLALLCLNDGFWNGGQIVSSDWIARTRLGDHSRFGSNFRSMFPNGAYSNQFWLESIEGKTTLALGIFGQLLYINPEADLVAVKLSSWPHETDPVRWGQMFAAIHAIEDAVLNRGVR